jgi:multidrug efflux pump subunit AcrA (membrane-fusion protein)
VFLLEDRGGGLGVVRRHPVRVGTLTRNGIEVLDGVTVGNVVVTAGVRRLSDGMQVRYTPDEDSPWM